MRHTFKVHSCVPTVERSYTTVGKGLWAYDPQYKQSNLVLGKKGGRFYVRNIISGRVVCKGTRKECEAYISHYGG